VSTILELAERAARLGFKLSRWHDPANHPFNPERVVFALRREGSSLDVRVGSARDVARLLDAIEEKAAA
jgi:hypothetical protein